MKEKLKRLGASTVVRNALRKLSPASRRNLRRAVKAAYWVATPHLMAQRVRMLRVRRKLGGVASISVLGAPGSLTPSYLCFTPEQQRAGGNPFLTAAEEGRYILETDWSKYHYSYVPPRRPDDIDARITALSTRPFFSIVVPAYNTPLDYLQRLLASVRAQWYENYELILVDDKSPDAAVRQAIQAAAADADKITAINLAENRGISGATNAGIDAARGDYIVFLDHDDELTADCLWELATAIDRTSADFLYSDEDKLLPSNQFSEPFFKPDWSPDTILSTMFTCHVSAVRRSLLDEIGGLRSEFDGAQDWDLVLRIAERTERIAHVPKVLYHWRVIPGSVAADLAEKPYAIDASVRAREAALKRRGIKGTLEPVAHLPGHARVRYALRGMPLISIIVPSRDNGAVLTQCIQSILDRSSYRNFEIVVMDNGSREPESVALLAKLAKTAQVRVVSHDRPFNYSEINNVGVRHASGEILLFLNDDTEVISADWLDRMAGFAQQAHVGAVGAKLIFPRSRSIQHCGIVNLAAGPGHAFLTSDADTPFAFARNMLEYDWLAVTGACLMIDRSKFDECGGFDETFPIAYNDVELCFRIVERGLYNVLCASVELTHHESLTRGDDSLDPARLKRLAQERRRLYARHSQFFMHDPFHNPNLSPVDLHFRIPAG
ncbi:glycosyltransferase family 2 protein [Caballeronia sp. GAFFF2]|uniref:glycosyltransferase family 2 protein n=1 Tax=Caballeronia sp. GAFFF2 TaxID=2921741 RepID=UPI0020278F01|nr:glycosyltransferase family 2 protein [Caballeronia sp. GAFFF2]